MGVLTLRTYSLSIANENCKCLYSLPLRFAADKVAWLAFVSAERSHFETSLVAAFGLQHGIWHRRRCWAAKFAESLWERPQTIFHAGKSVVCTWGNFITM